MQLSLMSARPCNSRREKVIPEATAWFTGEALLEYEASGDSGFGGWGLRPCVGAATAARPARLARPAMPAMAAARLHGTPPLLLWQHAATAAATAAVPLLPADCCRRVVNSCSCPRFPLVGCFRTTRRTRMRMRMMRRAMRCVPAQLLVLRGW